ncbi:MAG: Coenzyme F420 hydrogenase/dehydrogenase, beta subunit C-terminal domain [Synergistaceae bacterium]|nr:Coenzyme F420 hydrogenase/dehydrogenase, beta subunit C-terminal domain [Synergistaceae bacterium]
MITITDKEKCCGCSACMSICPVNAITMTPDSQGFLYPAVNSQTCINCGKCEAVCPILSPTPEREHEQEAYLLQHKDSEILRDSTSGGAFTAIAKSILDKGGVVFGAGYDEGFRVIHKYAEDYESLHAFRNSKYVQSDKRECFSEVKGFLEEGRYVLFSGTPCEAEGLVNFLGELSGAEHLLISDIVCHATPSPAVWQAYINLQMKKNEHSILDFRFRDKAKFGYLYSQFAVVRDKNSLYEGIETNMFLRAFFSNVCDRPSCYSCKFRKRYRVCDFTLWDCWDASQFTHDSRKFDPNAGITRMLVHSERGRKILPDVLTQCTYTRISPDDAVKYSSREMFCPVPKDEERYRKFWESFSDDPEGTLRRFFPKTAKTRIEALLRRIAFRTGMYSFVRGMYKKFFGERKR